MDKKNSFLKRFWLPALLFFIALILPLVVAEFWVHVFTEIIILGLFAAAFNLIFGYMGQLSFGQAAYYGIGAYTTGLLMVKLQWPLLACLPVSMITAGIGALILGYFCVKLRGIYFAILTMAFGQLVFFILFQWYSFTGGDNGLQGINPPVWLFKANAYYYFSLAVVTIGMIALYFITESPFGYTLRAIRDNTERTEFIGINVQRYMLINFVISGMFCGLAGALWGPFNRSVAPDLSQLAAFRSPRLYGGYGWSPSFSGSHDRFCHFHLSQRLCNRIYRILASGKWCGNDNSCSLDARRPFRDYQIKGLFQFPGCGRCEK